TAALLGAGLWTAVVYWLFYNALTQAVRLRGVTAGYASGAGIARVLQDPFWRRSAAATRLLGAGVGGAALALGTALGHAGGGWQGVGILWSSVALLGLAARPLGSGGRRLSPALAFLALVILLSALTQARAGTVP
ncbi:MAG TPA: hypothetical protein VJP59_06095, partial [Gemmatimonadota bacterium]|nr:hypothetical protein [Gemmatimonadota bacterium]